MRKLNFILILFQWFGLFFLINGILRLFYSFYAEQILYLLKVKEKSNSWKTLNILNDFLYYQVYWAFGTFILGVTVIAFLNWKNKNHFLNSIVLFLLVFVIFPSGIIFRGLISNYLNYFGGLFSKDYIYSFIIGGMIFSLIGGLLIWKSFSFGRGTAHNSDFIQ